MTHINGTLIVRPSTKCAMIFAAVLMPCLHDLGHLEHPCSHRRVYVRWQHRNYSGVQAEGWRSPGWRLSRARMSFGMVVWLSLVSIDVDILPLTHNKVRLPQATAEGEPHPYSEDTWTSHSCLPSTSDGESCECGATLSPNIEHFQLLKDVLYCTLSCTQRCFGSSRLVYGTDDEAYVCA